MVSIKSVPRKIAQILKSRLESLKILRKYQELPLANSHQEEVDENAINEALEARMAARGLPPRAQRDFAAIFSECIFLSMVPLPSV